MMSGTTETNAKLSTSNNLQIMSLGVALAQSSQLADIARLQAEANQEAREANEQLASISDGISVTSQWAEQAARQTENNGKTLRQLSEQVDTTNQLLIEQTRGIQSVKSSIDQLRFEAAWQNFSNWVQTDNGRTYQYWSKQATKLVNTMGEYTRRMSEARTLDLKDNTSRLVAKVPLTTGSQLPDKPVEPDYGPEPRQIRPEPVIQDENKELVKKTCTRLGLLVGAFAGMAVKVAPTWTPAQSTNPLTLVIPALVGLIIGWIVGASLGSIITKLMKTSRSGQESTKAHEQWVKEKTEYDREIADRSARREEYEHQVEAWNARVEQLQAYQMRQAENRQRHIEATPSQADSLLPQPTCWTVDDPNKIVNEIRSLMEHSFTFPPADMSILPETQLPVFALPESLPDNAKHMKAELARILEENRNNPHAKVAYSKPLHDMSAAERLRKFKNE